MAASARSNFPGCVRGVSAASLGYPARVSLGRGQPIAPAATAPLVFKQKGAASMQVTAVLAVRCAQATGS
jgi:hypothetical protein